MKNVQSKSYLGLLTGLLIGGIQHYLYAKALWGTFKPIAKVIDRRLNRR
jgi:hypothetical protein